MAETSVLKVKDTTCGLKIHKLVVQFVDSKSIN